MTFLYALVYPSLPVQQLNLQHRCLKSQKCGSDWSGGATTPQLGSTQSLDLSTWTSLL